MPIQNQALYFIVRSDLDSMTASRAAAQISHSAHQFARNHLAMSDNAVMSWENQSNGCGTSIVLKTNDIEQINKIIYVAKQHEMFADVYCDDSYSVRDGNFTHLVSIITCGHVFIDFSNIDHCNFYDIYLKNLETL